MIDRTMNDLIRVVFLIGAVSTSCDGSDAEKPLVQFDERDEPEVAFECVEDTTVYEVVVQDFLKNSDAAHGYWGDVGVVVVEPKSREPKFARHAFRGISSYLDESKKGDAESLLQVLLRANEVADEVSFRNPIDGIEIRELDQGISGYGYFNLGPVAADDPGKARAKIEFLAPAISADGNEALVHFSFWPTAHGAQATYFLDRCPGDGWKVRWFEYTYFL